jgi:indolepyruvate ferredoxin oxidoreductase beta subunit
MKKGDRINLIITGVGGQGILVAVELLGKACMKAGKNVLASEIHGMAQRGGIVTTSVKIGDAYSPSIPDGSADLILALEPVEALRQLKKLRKEGIIITDVHPVIPFEVTLGKAKYPDLKEVFSELEKNCGKLVLIDTIKLAKQAGSIVSRNVVLLGAFAGSGLLPFESRYIEEALKEKFKGEIQEQNISAFRLGLNEVSE